MFLLCVLGHLDSGLCHSLSDLGKGNNLSSPSLSSSNDNPSASFFHFFAWDLLRVFCVKYSAQGLALEYVHPINNMLQ